MRTNRLRAVDTWFREQDHSHMRRSWSPSQTKGIDGFTCIANWYALLNYWLIHSGWSLKRLFTQLLGALQLMGRDNILQGYRTHAFCTRFQSPSVPSTISACHTWQHRVRIHLPFWLTWNLLRLEPPRKCIRYCFFPIADAFFRFAKPYSSWRWAATNLPQKPIFMRVPELRLRIRRIQSSSRWSWCGRRLRSPYWPVSLGWFESLALEYPLLVRKNSISDMFIALRLTVALWWFFFRHRDCWTISPHCRGRSGLRKELDRRSLPSNWEVHEVLRNDGCGIEFRHFWQDMRYIRTLLCLWVGLWACTCWYTRYVWLAFLVI